MRINYLSEGTKGDLQAGTDLPAFPALDYPGAARDLYIAPICQVQQKRASEKFIDPERQGQGGCLDGQLVLRIGGRDGRQEEPGGLQGRGSRRRERTRGHRGGEPPGSEEPSRGHFPQGRHRREPIAGHPGAGEVDPREDHRAHHARDARERRLVHRDRQQSQKRYVGYPRRPVAVRPVLSVN